MKQFYLFLFLILLAEKIEAQPGTNVKELYRGRHRVMGSNYGHPYTVFDMNNHKSFSEILLNIRKRLIDEKKKVGDSLKPVFLAYLEVYKNAIGPRPPDDGMPNTGVSGLALWAKNKAFVFLIGLDENAYWMDTHMYPINKIY